MNIMPDTSTSGKLRDYIAGNLSNWLLNHIATPWYRYMIAGLIRSGQEAVKINEAKAFAWDLGFNAGHYAEGEKHECDCQDNPYRTQTKEES